jgi:Rieske 2Fe-2S family protein
MNGALRGAGHTPEGFDKKKFGLKKVNVRVFHGMIFINLAANPVPFEDIERDLDAPLAPYRLAEAKVAHRQNYPLKANWKLAVENYCECYHCLPSHPEYSVGHGRAMPDAEFAALLAEVVGKASDVGLTAFTLRRSWLAAGAIGVDRGFERYPLLRGHVTGSRDGQAVAPLLGELRGYDGGATDLHLGPVTFGLAYCDHVVLYRFTPQVLHQTDCEITWLVNESAQEGRDYDRAALTWLWDVTTIADKRIIEHNQQGINSRFYMPGPLSQMEDFTRRFIEWYVEVVRQKESCP